MSYKNIDGHFPKWKGLPGQISHDPKEVKPQRAAFGPQSSGHYFDTYQEAEKWLKSRKNKRYWRTKKNEAF